MKIFRLIVECEVEDDIELVIGAVTGLDSFDGHCTVDLEVVNKHDPTEEVGENDDKENDDEKENDSE